jgi:hypothetical protein
MNCLKPRALLRPPANTPLPHLRRSVEAMRREPIRTVVLQAAACTKVQAAVVRHEGTGELPPH